MRCPGYKQELDTEGTRSFYMYLGSTIEANFLLCSPKEALRNVYALDTNIKSNCPRIQSQEGSENKSVSVVTYSY